MVGNELNLEIGLGQAKAGIHECIAINKKDVDRKAILENAKLALGKVMLGK